MRTRDQIAGYFDRKASSFDAIYSGQKGLLPQLWDRLTRQNIHHRLEFTMRALSPVTGKRVLDVGCGSGRYCIELAARGAAQVVGVDLSPQMLELAERLAKERRVHEQCRFLQKDIIDYEAEEPFDAVIAMGFFDYVQQPEQVLVHLRSLTRHTLVASFPTLWALRVPFRKVWLTLQHCPLHFITESEISRLCQKAGFVCTTLIRSGPIYLLIAEPDSSLPSS